MQPNNNNTLLQNINNNVPNKKTNNNNNNTTSNHHHHRSHGSTTQACAACKYQRRKCAADCILAPYFPHDRQHQFLNAHRLFGVSNIVKIVRHLDPAAKDHAMRTIIFQSDARAADPVGGCHRIIRELEHQISLAKAELDVVLHHLALCRAAAARHHMVADPAMGMADEVVVIDDVNSSWSTCMHGGNVNSNNNGHAESTTSSSFVHHHDHDHINHHHMMRSLSMEDCNQMKSILDHLSGDDDDTREDHHYNFDSHGNILSRLVNFLFFYLFPRSVVIN
ncbi:LOB domain-containing protein 22 [Phtheirospermum japonicum]|uniref:LOB domain-containing protein 22 n=1 Tax=Phtheirospermum japonicum TaxID=374723 RepID=A0A830BHP5_9LAMI|nr:LOB domain-containing protein 22 [Phtheirospermum japonicum]